MRGKWGGGGGDGGCGGGGGGGTITCKSGWCEVTEQSSCWSSVRTDHLCTVFLKILFSYLPLLTFQLLKLCKFKCWHNRAFQHFNCGEKSLYQSRWFMHACTQDSLSQCCLFFCLLCLYVQFRWKWLLFFTSPIITLFMDGPMPAMPSYNVNFVNTW